MIKHIVIWSFKEEAESLSKKENLKKVKEMLLSLPKEIPEIIYFEVSENINSVPRNGDLILVSHFDSLAALETYANHPAHQTVVQYVKLVVQDRLAIDYEE